MSIIKLLIISLVIVVTMVIVIAAVEFIAFNLFRENVQESISLEVEDIEENVNDGIPLRGGQCDSLHHCLHV